MIDVSIIILSYNTQFLTLQCLESVHKAAPSQNVEVIVVDNASSDDSVAEIQKQYPTVKLVCNTENVGYARANNQAIKLSQGQIIILLNSDTKLFPDAITSLVDGFEDSPNAGVIGPMLLNDDLTIQPSYGSFTSISTEFLFHSFLYKIIPTSFVVGQTIHHSQVKAYQSPHPVDWITGACFAIRRDVTNRVGLLREDLFMYGEDLEWCWRVRQAGFQVMHCPQAKVFHYSRQSSRKNYKRWIVNYTEGQLRFTIEHLSFYQIRAIGMLTFLGSMLRVFLWAAVNLFFPKKGDECRQRIEGYLQALKLGIKVVAFGKLA